MRVLGTLFLSALGFASAAGIDEWQEQVRKAETAFARSMADRDHSAFASYLANDAVFMSGARAVRGAQAADWKRFFDGPRAPFSWEPQTVVQLRLAPGEKRPVEDRARQRLPAL
jgi:hypothetical protein